MFLRSLRAHCFRNLKSLDVAFEPGANLFFGGNGQGKSNLLEAIYVLANTKSFRTAHLGQCLQQGESQFFLQGEVRRNGIDRKIVLSWQAGVRDLRLHDKSALPLHYLGNLDALAVSFDQLPIVRGAPSERRRFLDRGIAQLKKAYLHTLADFHRALRQRNGLLLRIRSGTAAIGELEPWEEIYADLALAVTQERERYVQRLNEHLPAVRFSEDDLRLEYVASVGQRETKSLCKAFAVLRPHEIRYARTLQGPHRDELKILLGENEIQKFGSGGQQRSAVFTLLFAVLDIYFIENKEHPVLLIDDLDAELDADRLRAILEGLQTGRQVFISSSKKKLIESIGCGKKWEVRGGILSPADSY